MALLCASAGCRTAATTTAAQFPAVWPAGADLPPVQKAQPPGPGSGIAIAVAPWMWPSAPATSSAGERLTTETLTQLTQTALRAQGFDVVEEHAASYRLGCTVRDLRYTVSSGYPARRSYLADVECQLLRRSDQRLVWQRQFAEHTEETLYVNTYTRAPATHARTFAWETLPAVMERLTSSLVRFFREGLPLYEEGATPATPLYQK